MKVPLKYAGPHDVVDVSAAGADPIRQPDGTLAPRCARGQTILVDPEGADGLLAQHHIDPAGPVHVWSWVPADDYGRKLAAGRELPHEVDARAAELPAEVAEVAAPEPAALAEDMTTGEDA